jgi:hypothetical protein
MLLAYRENPSFFAVAHRLADQDRKDHLPQIRSLTCCIRAGPASARQPTWHYTFAKRLPRTKQNQ